MFHFRGGLFSALIRIVPVSCRRYLHKVVKRLSASIMVSIYFLLLKKIFQFILSYIYFQLLYSILSEVIIHALFLLLTCWSIRKDLGKAGPG